MSPTTTTAASVEIVEKTTTFTSSVAAASPTAPNTTKTTKKNYQRKRTDYIWLYNFLLFYIAVGEWFWPQRSSPQDRAYILASCNPLGFTSGYAIWGFWFAVTVSSLYGFTGALWYFMKWANPATTPETHFSTQAEAIKVNFILLSVFQALWDYGTASLPIGKVMEGNLHPLEIIRDTVLWMACFELAWYTQHRAMHDVKFLWTNGHAYHHSWRRPEHMIGITNFAFDHIVEIWVTMSSSFLGYIIFPANFWVGKIVSLAYMILAVFAHWDGFDFSRYHINHHYLVTKNYGSHIPIFDMIFGTYQWEKYEHPDSTRVKQNVVEKNE